MDIAKSGEKTIIYLDSEGLFASNVSEVYDAKIFSICTLLSSYMIYNTVRIIDESSIDFVEYVHLIILELVLLVLTLQDCYLEELSFFHFVPKWNI